MESAPLFRSLLCIKGGITIPSVLCLFLLPFLRHIDLCTLMRYLHGIVILCCSDSRFSVQNHKRKNEYGTFQETESLGHTDHTTGTRWHLGLFLTKSRPVSSGLWLHCLPSEKRCFSKKTVEQLFGLSQPHVSMF